MKRSALDKLISSTGLIVATVLLLAAGGLYYTYGFVHGQVRDQLSAQSITFPAAGSKELAGLDETDRTQVSKYAGEPLTTGAQAEVFADNYIGAHLKHIGNGQTYAQLSSKSMAHPQDMALKGQVESIFRGETLRGLLLNAYAFDTVALVAKVASLVAAVAAVLLYVLALLGFQHSSKTKKRR